MKRRHKKTRKEKIIADRRHYAYTLENKSGNPISLHKNISVSNPTVSAATINVNPYSYVTQDILKTGILTFLIIIAQLTLFFLLGNQVIKIPGLSY